MGRSILSCVPARRIRVDEDWFSRATEGRVEASDLRGSFTSATQVVFFDIERRFFAKHGPLMKARSFLGGDLLEF